VVSSKLVPGGRIPADRQGSLMAREVMLSRAIS